MTGNRTSVQAGVPRGWLLAALIFIFATLVAPIGAVAQEDVLPRELGEQPTTGGLRPGPVGIDPGMSAPGVRPMAIRIEAAGVDAPIEQRGIINGVMQDPSGPFVVAWYQETGRLGEVDNMVYSGHLDYWDVGEAVFFNVWQLEEGDVIEILGQDEQFYQYRVEWLRNYNINQLTPEAIQEIIGPTDIESVTLITCGGPFDYERGEYEERIVIRASRIAGAI
jgi:hypothetical protein